VFVDLTSNIESEANVAVRPVAGIGFSVLLVGACVGILTAPMYGLIQLRKMDQDQRVWTAEIEQRQAERARLAGLIDEQLKALRQAEVSLAGTKAELDALTTERNRIQAEIAGDSEQLSARERRLAGDRKRCQEPLFCCQ
jgi:septal ring factor EnvC (AmiA/AmiB activator)